VILATAKVRRVLDSGAHVVLSSGRSPHGMVRIADLLGLAVDEDDRIWVVFDWDEDGWQSFVSDPEVPAIFQEGGLQGRPMAAELVRPHDA